MNVSDGILSDRTPREGDEITVTALVVNGHGKRVRPTSTCMCEVWVQPEDADESDIPDRVRLYEMPEVDASGEPGLVVARFRLDDRRFYVNRRRYHVFAWLFADGISVKYDQIKLSKGFGNRGDILGMTYWRRPEHDIVVAHESTGDIVAGHDPAVRSDQ